MANIRYDWNYNKPGGFEYQRRKPETQKLLRRAAEAIRAGAAASGPGDGYIVSPSQGRTRARVNVVAWSTYARRDNAEDNSILKSVDLGRRAI